MGIGPESIKCKTFTYSTMFAPRKDSPLKTTWSILHSTTLAPQERWLHDTWSRGCGRKGCNMRLLDACLKIKSDMVPSFSSRAPGQEVH